MPKKTKKNKTKPKFDHNLAARELVIEVLLRGAHLYGDKGELAPKFQTDAAQRLDSLAYAIDPKMYVKVSKERDTCLKGFTQIMESMLE